MSFNPLPASSPPAAAGPPATGSTHFAWPDVAVLTLVVVFAAFLIVRGMSVTSASVTSVSMISSASIVLFTSRKAVDAVRALQQIGGMLGSLSNLSTTSPLSNPSTMASSVPVPTISTEFMTPDAAKGPGPHDQGAPR